MVRKHCASFRHPPNGAQKGRWSATQGRSKLQKDGSGYPSLPELEDEEATLVLAGPSPSLAGMGVWQLQLPICEASKEGQSSSQSQIWGSPGIEAGQRKCKT